MKAMKASICVAVTARGAAACVSPGGTDAHGDPTGQLASNRLSISSRSKVKSIGLVSSPVAPPSVAFRLVSGSP